MKKSKLAAVVVALSLVVFAGAGTTGKAVGNTVTPELKIHAKATSTYVSGYSPAKIRTAYGIDQLANQGAGKTIAIVDAYGDANIKSDIKTFDSQFGLADPTISVVYPNGKPSSDGGWALETALDVEWAHAVAPQAKIMVVAARSASDSYLLSAISYANTHGADVVSMSWGGDESSSESSYDSYFSHSGTVYLASSGDDGAQESWPASSANVVAVGGTTLNLDSSNHRSSETAWDGSGGGVSSVFSKPSWQTKMGISASGRAIPDVSFDADPSTGVAVYSSVSYDGTKGWWVVGGTSLSAPAWAGLIAIADDYSQISDIHTLLYDLAGGTSYSSSQTNFYDITSGSNGYSATTGYDYVTGLGSPIANNLIPQM